MRVAFVLFSCIGGVSLDRLKKTEVTMIIRNLSFQVAGRGLEPRTS